MRAVTIGVVRATFAREILINRDAARSVAVEKGALVRVNAGINYGYTNACAVQRRGRRYT
jgi:hypothetical protein